MTSRVSYQKHIRKTKNYYRKINRKLSLGNGFLIVFIIVGVIFIEGFFAVLMALN